MSKLRIAVVPVGKVESDEVEAAMVRLTKGLRRPVELKGSLNVPQGVEDTGRNQFRASTVMTRLRSMVAQLGPGKMVGAEDEAGAKPPLVSEAYIFVTDVDLYTANSDAVFGALMLAKKLAVVSVRRLRESHYRRKSDPVKQRTRLVKEMLRMAARLQGHPECASPKCVLSASKMFADIDLKDERFCRDCTQRIFEGKIRI